MNFLKSIRQTKKLKADNKFMAIPVILPKPGNTVETCLIASWKKRVGEEVKKGEVICEFETDKAMFEVESPDHGILLDIFFNEGEDVPVLTNICVIGSPGDDYSEFKPQRISAIENTPEKSGDITPGSSEEKVDESVKGESDSRELFGRKNISPRARNTANKLGININELTGTGPDGRIIERDVWEVNKELQPLTLAAKDMINDGSFRPKEGSGLGSRVTSEDIKKAKKAEEQFLAERDKKVVPLKGIRKIIAERMLTSLQQSAQLTLNNSADASVLLALRKRFKESSTFKDFQSVTINDLVHYATIKALLENPELNSLLIGDKIEYHKKINLGFAVDTPRGLMVPVVKDSQRLNLLELSNEAKKLAAACRSGKISTDDMNGATITVTNLGSYGIESFTPVLNLPQTAIIGVNTITLKSVEQSNDPERSGQVVRFIPHISFSLTIDHRVIDGAVGARFLQSLSKIISEIDVIIALEGVKK
jgi:pyruvate dehydrogenase E2 component (dihydrolipoamide acetyltransferase)